MMKKKLKSIFDDDIFIKILFEIQVKGKNPNQEK
jgi:hypothetical protein